MTCHEFTDFIMAWLDGELPPAQKAVFDEHMDICGDCVRYLENYRKTVALGQAAYAPVTEKALREEVPEELVQAVLAARRLGRD